jgi:hypothetical protein
MLWVHDGFMMGSCMVPLSFGLWTLPALPWLKSERWYWVSSPSSWQLHWSPPGCSWQVTSPPSVSRLTHVIFRSYEVPKCSECRA